MRAGGGKAGAARRPGRVRRRGAVALLLALAYAAGLLMFVLGGRVSLSSPPPPGGVEVASLLLRRRRRAEEASAPPRPGSVYRSHLVFDRLWPAMRDDAARAASASSSVSSAASWRRSMVASLGEFLRGFLLDYAKYSANFQHRFHVLALIFHRRSLTIPQEQNKLQIALVSLGVYFKILFRNLMTSHYQNSAESWVPCVNSRLTRSELPPSNGYLMVEANGGLNQQRLSICDAVAVASMLNATLVIPTFHLNSVWRDRSKFGDIFDEDHFIATLREHVRVVKTLPEDVLLGFNYNISSIPNMRTKAYSSPNHYVQKVLPKLLELGVVRIAPFSNRLAQSVPSNIQALRRLGWSNDPKEFFDWWEVGMMLRGMGFDNTTSLYVASGKIYNSEKYMAPLRQMFPLLVTKDTLALPEELAQFKGHSSRLAALDYTVCIQSEVFVTTQGGNFPHFVMGQALPIWRERKDNKT
ncbi:hypothetical protein PR202_gb00397 [Eleusine coracana subsp. coracana]|uniref:O-fucosyltransferase family protein n=1 Tax=Eleusine coracana subsp. coracana TaxID=191504 RepID=A0AAV5DT77_ELECO|nr:hypothetical protein PR202_gb00397 [Eleusine coracana subsp. coracana]